MIIEDTHTELSQELNDSEVDSMDDFANNSDDEREERDKIIEDLFIKEISSKTEIE